MSTAQVLSSYPSLAQFFAPFDLTSEQRLELMAVLEEWGVQRVEQFLPAMHEYVADLPLKRVHKVQMIQELNRLQGAQQHQVAAQRGNQMLVVCVVLPFPTAVVCVTSPFAALIVRCHCVCRPEEGCDNRTKPTVETV